MNYGFKQGSAIGIEQMQKDYSAACNVNMNPVGSQARPAFQDPACLREQYQELLVLCERINVHRSRLRDIADVVLGSESEGPTPTTAPSPIPQVGGIVGDIVSAFETAAMLLSQVDHEITRLSRVSS